MLKRRHNLRKNKPYLGPPLPDDITRMILMHATHSGATVRVVCKSWLRISNCAIDSVGRTRLFWSEKVKYRLGD